LYRRLGGPQRWSRHDGEEKNSQPLPGIEPSIIQPVDQRYTTELSRLLKYKYIESKLIKFQRMKRIIKRNLKNKTTKDTPIKDNGKT
jgi:hypothetical protein